MFSCRSVVASMRSTTWRFSSSLVGHGETAQATGAVEVRDARALDEDLLDVAPGDQIGEGTEVGDRPQHPVGHLRRIDER